MARAREDVAAIDMSMMQMMKEIGESAFYRHGQSGEDNTPGRDLRSNPVGLLIGDGDVPDEGPSGSDDWRGSIFDNVSGESTDFNRSVVVISAGSDEQIDTKFGTPIGLSIWDDDIAYPIAYGTLR